jgi:uncharacterized protein
VAAPDGALRPLLLFRVKATIRPPLAFAVKIPVERITETPQALHFAASPAWWRERCARDEEVAAGVFEDLAVRVAVHRMGADLFLDGEVCGALELTCGRCLSRYRQPLRERFRLLLEPAGHRVPADPEGAETLRRDGLVLSDELESGWFQGSEIRLDRFIQEMIALQFPVQPLCREECLGLCPHCGIDRNAESCDCREVRVASPFAMLGALRGRSR